jgi:hypothetical protein
VLDGERNWNLDLTDRDWVDAYPIDRMRAMSSPHTWGIGICWMANLDSTNQAKAAFGKLKQGEYVWMYDSWINPYVQPGPTRMPVAALDWGLNGGNTVYEPFWRNEAARANADDVLVSLWRMPGESRAMLGVYNYNRTATRNAKITLDLPALGLDRGALAARDLYAPAGEPTQLDADKGVVTVKGLKPATGCLVAIRKY